jgi:hypothetical protein
MINYFIAILLVVVLWSSLFFDGISQGHLKGGCESIPVINVPGKMGCVFSSVVGGGHSV